MIDVELKFTGNVRARMGADRVNFTFEGTTLGELLQALLHRFNLQDLLLDEDGNISPYARLAVNGRFSYLVGDLDAPIQNGDMVTLMHPYIVATRTGAFY